LIAISRRLQAAVCPGPGDPAKSGGRLPDISPESPASNAKLLKKKPFRSGTGRRGGGFPRFSTASAARRAVLHAQRKTGAPAAVKAGRRRQRIAGPV
jgi:hypothetical protein